MLAVMISIVTGGFALATTIVTLILNRGQNRMNKKQDKIHEQLNGMQDALIVAEKSASKAEGVKEGSDEERAKEK